MGGRGPILVVLVALVGGAVAWWVAAAPGATSTSTSTLTSPSVPPPRAGEGGRRPGGGRSTSPPPGDDPALRARLHVHAKVAVPEWRAFAQHVEPPGLRAEAEAMAERLARLDEDAELLARAEYDLTQRLITHGGWKSTALRQLQRLNSEAAMVIQGE